MFKDIDLIFIFGPALVIATTINIALSSRLYKKDIPEINKAVKIFKVMTILFGALLIILYMLTPSTGSLSTFGYPDHLKEIQEERLLHLLQKYNRAIVRTADVVKWFLFLFVWWFLGTLYSVARVFTGGKMFA